MKLKIEYDSDSNMHKRRCMKYTNNTTTQLKTTSYLNSVSKCCSNMVHTKCQTSNQSQTIKAVYKFDFSIHISN